MTRGTKMIKDYREELLKSYETNIDMLESALELLNDAKSCFIMMHASDEPAFEMLCNGIQFLTDAKHDIQNHMLTMNNEVFNE